VTGDLKGVTTCFKPNL